MIKSDKWIRRMALGADMIVPFYERQTININTFAPAISFGLSSYGYDIRVGDKFKIFTNVFTSIVDPKNFDPRMVLSLRATDGYIIIPPNSFALAETAEHFKIPRNVLTVCVGKSTYARCFSGDTQVALVDGTAVSLEAMAERQSKGEDFWGYSIGEHGRIAVTKLEAARFIGRDAMIQIVLDNDQTIYATPDHEFISRDGLLVQASMLRAGASLMPLYRELVRGYEAVYQPINGHLTPTHRLSDEWNLRHGVYEESPGTHRHHRDHDRRNNRPWNIERMEASAHIRHHNQENYGEGFDPAEHGAAISAALASRRTDPHWAAAFSKVQSRRAIDFWHRDAYSEQRRALIEKHRNPSNETREARRQGQFRRFLDPRERARLSEAQRLGWIGAEDRRERQREVARGINTRTEIDERAVREALNQAGSIRGAARILNCDRTVFRRFPQVVAEVHGRRNHKVVAVRDLRGEHDVYCLTVPEAGNFALEAGVFVRNCGIIVNVTPFEPEWEGVATLEISNTTPLPAKIYAGEGIAQVLFFEGDEACETSYADRQGRYQNQEGLTPPRVG